MCFSLVEVICNTLSQAFYRFVDYWFKVSEGGSVDFFSSSRMHLTSYVGTVSHSCWLPVVYLHLCYVTLWLCTQIQRLCWRSHGCVYYAHSSRRHSCTSPVRAGCWQVDMSRPASPPWRRLVEHVSQGSLQAGWQCYTLSGLNGVLGPLMEPEDALTVSGVMSNARGVVMVR